MRSAGDGSEASCVPSAGFETVATSVMNPKGGVLRFFGRGGRVVLRAQPEGDGWWWFEGNDGAMVAAVGRERGRLHDLDGEVVASVGDGVASIRGRDLCFDAEAWTVSPVVPRVTRPGARGVQDPVEPVVAVDREAGVLKVRYRPPSDRFLAVLVALCLPARSPYITPTERPLSQETVDFFDSVAGALGLAGDFLL